MSMDTSSFFWLGLVASLFLGLFLTVFRSRNARLAARRTLHAGHAPLVRPELWEVNIAPQAALGVADTVVRKWEELVPLAARTKAREDSANLAQRPRRTSRWRRFCIRHRSRRPNSGHDQDYASDDEAQTEEGQIAMLILLPSPRPTPAFHAANEPQPTPEYAVGTIVCKRGEFIT